ncbi:MAG: protein kinase, partial [Ktedonobacteraceae bacterium]
MLEQPLGHYRLVRLLGQGGFAEVYLGEHIHLATQVAVKVLHTRLADEDVLAFKREAQTVARLLHPNIVRVLDFGVEGAIPYLVMDYAPNGTLRHAFPKGSRVPLHAVISFTKQVAAALQYAHSQRLIHRDIKPENMLLGRNREVLLSDFGIALVQQSSRANSTQNIAGTVAYMAPEQIQAHPCAASDQYSLGVVVYEWLCGSRPFQGSYTEIAIKQSMVLPPPLRTYAPDIPPPVEQVVMQALQKDPWQRFADVRTFALALEQAAFQSGTRQTLSTAMLPQTTPPLPASTNMSGSSSTFIPGASMPIMSSASTQTPTGLNSPSSSFYTPYPASMQQAQPLYPFPYTPPLPQVSRQPLFDPSLPNREQKRRLLSRRAFMVGGAIGLVAAGSIGTDLILTHVLHGTQASHNQSPYTSDNTGSGSSNPNSTAVVQNGVQATVELTYNRHSSLVWLVRWSPDGKYIASGSFDGTMMVWAADTGETRLSVRSTVQPAQSDDYPWSLAWSPRKDQRIAVRFVDGTIQVLDASNEQRLPSLTNPTPGVAVLAWSPDEQHLVIGGSDSIVRVYEYPAWKVVTTYQEHTNNITALAWSPDGQTIASGSEDTTIRLWEALSGHTRLIY